MSSDDQYQFCFVKVLEVTQIVFKNGEYKRVKVVHETGYWHEQFSFNLFGNSEIFDSVEPGSKLFITVNVLLFPFDSRFTLVTLHII